MKNFIIAYQRESDKDSALFISHIMKVEAEDEKDAEKRFTTYQNKRGIPSVVLGVSKYTKDYDRPDGPPALTDEEYRKVIN